MKAPLIHRFIFFISFIISSLPFSWFYFSLTFIIGMFFLWFIFFLISASFCSVLWEIFSIYFNTSDEFLLGLIYFKYLRALSCSLFPFYRIRFLFCGCKVISYHFKDVKYRVLFFKAFLSFPCCSCFLQVSFFNIYFNSF